MYIKKKKIETCDLTKFKVQLASTNFRSIHYIEILLAKFGAGFVLVLK